MSSDGLVPSASTSSMNGLYDVEFPLSPSSLGLAKSNSNFSLIVPGCDHAAIAALVEMNQRFDTTKGRELLGRCKQYFQHLGTGNGTIEEKINIFLQKEGIEGLKSTGEHLIKELRDYIRALKKHIEANEDSDEKKVNLRESRAVVFMLILCVVAYVAIASVLGKGLNLESGLTAAGIALGTGGVGFALKKRVKWLNRDRDLDPHLLEVEKKLAQVNAAHQKVLEAERRQEDVIE